LADTESDARVQYAALPWRAGEVVEILLASSRDTRRWVIPKGWPMKNRKPHGAAALEALEEAGIVGKIEKAPIGHYHYYKRLKNGARLLCRVEVFPMKVVRQRKTWREQSQRVTQWVPIDEAAELVGETELSELIRRFGEKLLGRNHPSSATQPPLF
jgi:8-oxo-dGTP pyrophosphatase MutT (NUDIX family)